MSRSACLYVYFCPCLHLSRVSILPSLLRKIPCLSLTYLGSHRSMSSAHQFPVLTLALLSSGPSVGPLARRKGLQYADQRVPFISTEIGEVPLSRDLGTQRQVPHPPTSPPRSVLLMSTEPDFGSDEFVEATVSFFDSSDCSNATDTEVYTVAELYDLFGVEDGTSCSPSGDFDLYTVIHCSDGAPAAVFYEVGHGDQWPPCLRLSLLTPSSRRFCDRIWL